MKKHPFGVVRGHNAFMKRLERGGRGVRWHGVQLSRQELIDAKDHLLDNDEILYGPWRRYELRKVLDHALRMRVIGQ